MISGPSTSADASGPPAPTASNAAIGRTSHRPRTPSASCARRPGTGAEIGGRAGSVSCIRVHRELRRDRQLADAAARGVEDGVGDRRADADLTDLADAL